MSEKMTCEVWEYHNLEDLARNLEESTEPMQVKEVQELGKRLRLVLDQFGVTNDGDSL